MIRVYYLPYGVDHPVDAKALAFFQEAGIEVSVLKKDGNLRNHEGGYVFVTGHTSGAVSRVILLCRKAGIPAECLELK